jgi:biuret amidohydrolase
MSAFEARPLDIALRDCGINSFIIVGVATEIGIEPTIRHGADLGATFRSWWPMLAGLVTRSWETMKFMGDAMLTDIQAILRVLSRMRPA